MEQGVVRMARGLLEQEQPAAGAGTVAGLGRTPGISRALPKLLVPPGPAERTEAQRDWLVHAPMPAGGAGDTSPSSGCPHAQLPSPAWHTSEGKGCHEQAWGDTREAHGSDRDVTFPTASHQPGGSPAAQDSPLGSCARGQAPAPRSDAGGWVMALPLGSPGTAGLGRAAGLVRRSKGAWWPCPCRPTPGSRAGLPVCAGPSIRHAALSAGSLLSPRQ